ncbi:MAG: DUF2089 domain-containing protein [Brevefilum sp.]
MGNLPHRCPSCSGSLEVSELSCTECDTVVRGHYSLSPLCRLSPESLNFLESFILNRGNVKEMERNTGQSYWAIRRRLDEVIAGMDLSSEKVPPEGHDRRQEILRRLQSGEISVREAAVQLRELGE